jgi:hypothetical protein
MIVVSAVLDVAITPCKAESPRVSCHESCERCPKHGNHAMCMAKSPSVSCHDNYERCSRRGYHAMQCIESHGKLS